MAYNIYLEDFLTSQNRIVRITGVPPRNYTPNIFTFSRVFSFQIACIITEKAITHRIIELFFIVGCPAEVQNQNKIGLTFFPQ